MESASNTRKQVRIGDYDLFDFGDLRDKSFDFQMIAHVVCSKPICVVINLKETLRIMHKHIPVWTLAGSKSCKLM